MKDNPVDLIAETILQGELLPAEPSLTCDDPLQREKNAVMAFLYRWRNSPHTLRRYQTEISRLWLWSAEHDLLISQLTSLHLDLYEDFLRDPVPHDKWCSGAPYPKSSPKWRPFVSGLSLTSIQNAFNAIRALMTAWLKSGYISSDPMALKAKISASMEDGISRSPTAPVESADKWFDDLMAPAIKQALSLMPQDTPAEFQKAEQYRLIIRTLTVTGARVSELVSASQSQIYEDRSGWWIRLRGKGGKIRNVPLPTDYVTEVLMPWRINHSLPAAPLQEESTPLCPPRVWISGKKGLTSRMVLMIVKDVAAMATELLPPEAQRASKLLPRASNHWFRHTFITALIDRDVPTKTIMLTVGQSSEQTLRTYDHKKDQDRHDDVTRVVANL